MREDIWYRGKYSPTAAGEYRTHCNEFNVWLVDRAGYDPRGQLAWEAVPFEAPAYKAAVDAHKLMSQSLGQAPFNASGYFLPEQLRQWAATIAARKAEQGALPAACAALAVFKVNDIALMPLLHATVNLQRAELIPDTRNAMQAQLLMYACKKADDPALLSWALHIRQHDQLEWVITEALERHGNIAQHLELSSPELINLMRQDLINRTATAEADGVLANSLWHFPEGTPIAQAHSWLDQAANHPIEPSVTTGSVRVIRDMSGTMGAERLVSDGQWHAIDREHSTAKAAIGAYNWGQDHAPTVIEGNHLKTEGFCQLAASLAGNLLSSPLMAAQIGIEQAKEQATRFFTCARDLAFPERSSDDEGVRHQLSTLSEHRLTRAGIANLFDLVQNHPSSRPQSLVALKLPESKELALGVTMNDPWMRLNLHCEPKVYLRVGSPSHALSRRSAAEISADLDKMAIAAGIGQFRYRSVDNLTHAEPQPNEYKVALETEKRGLATEQETSVGVYEPSELKLLFRNKGISETPTVAQFGDGSWQVAWRSETPDESREYFEQGVETYYTLNLLEANDVPVSPEIAQVFADEVGVKFSNPYAPSMIMIKGSTQKIG